jgi:leucyl aminopeptidase
LGCSSRWVGQTQTQGMPFSCSAASGEQKVRGFSAEHLSTLRAFDDASGVMTVTHSSAAASSEVGALVVFVTREGLAAAPSVDCGVFGSVPASALPVDYKADAGEVAVVNGSPDGGAARLVLVGLGAEESVDTDSFRKAVHSAISACKSCRDVKHAGVWWPSVASLSVPEAVAADTLCRTSILSNHYFDKYLSSATATATTTSEKTEGAVDDVAPDSKTRFLSSLCIFSGEDEGESARMLNLADASATLRFAFDDASAVSMTELLTKSASMGYASVLSRELANDRAEAVSPSFLEDVALRLGRTHEHLTVTAVQEDELNEQGYCMITSVGRAANEKARLVVLDYSPPVSADSSSSSSGPICLVGKGITFDTGGLHLKTGTFMDGMDADMGGAAAVLGAMQGIASMGLSTRVVGVLAVAENAIDADSYKPMAVLQSAHGISVEVGNTDAEGRLALADALTYVQKHYPKPSCVIDIATLTGACVVALGEYSAGVFTNSDQLASTVTRGGSAVFERAWHMPIFPEHRRELKCAYADVSSTGAGRYGGASTAAAFLEKFVEKGTRWAHIDIAGPGMYSAQREHMNKGGTGFGSQLLTEVVASLELDEASKSSK